MPIKERPSGIRAYLLSPRERAPSDTGALHSIDTRFGRKPGKRRGSVVLLKAVKKMARAADYQPTSRSVAYERRHEAPGIRIRPV